jgi:phosphatidylserine/phosphatidylglycerophosphate/cardiolipin synthase-like enzyme
VGEARHSLELALYSVRLPGAVGDKVADAIRDAHARGVKVRIVYNAEDPAEPFPPPPLTEPPVLETLGVPIKGIPERFDLMHHKYVVRDGAAVWTGSANWSLDSWQREENVIVRLLSPPIAAEYLENFAYLWKRGKVEDSGRQETANVRVGHATVRPWFCPGQARGLTSRIASAIGCARRRVRIASPVITSAAILSTIAEELTAGELDIAGVVDATQVDQVLYQWERNGNVSWKMPLLEQLVASGRFTGKRSTPWTPSSVHDFMHAKVTVADDCVFVGSFNLSRSGESNAENVLEIHDPALADRLAAWIDEVRGRYPALEPSPRP